MNNVFKILKGEIVLEFFYCLFLVFLAVFNRK